MRYGIAKIHIFLILVLLLIINLILALIFFNISMIILTKICVFDYFR